MARGNSESPNLRGLRVCMDAADHPHAGEDGIVIDQEPCHLCGGCEYDDLVVRLDSGEITRVYEPEASVVDAAL